MTNKDRGFRCPCQVHLLVDDVLGEDAEAVVDLVTARSAHRGHVTAEFGKIQIFKIYCDTFHTQSDG